MRRHAPEHALARAKTCLGISRRHAGGTCAPASRFIESELMIHSKNSGLESHFCILTWCILEMPPPWANRLQVLIFWDSPMLSGKKYFASWLGCRTPPVLDARPRRRLPDLYIWHTWPYSAVQPCRPAQHPRLPDRRPAKPLAHT